MKRHYVTAGIIALLLAGCGSSQPQTRSWETGPSDADASRWATNWCDVVVGSTREAASKIMGPPTEFTDADASWTGFGYQFIAFFDENGTVRQLDFNDIMASAAQKARIRCADSRR